MHRISNGLLNEINDIWLLVRRMKIWLHLKCHYIYLNFERSFKHSSYLVIAQQRVRPRRLNLTKRLSYPVFCRRSSYHCFGGIVPKKSSRLPWDYVGVPKDIFMQSLRELGLSYLYCQRGSRKSAPFFLEEVSEWQRQCTLYLSAACSLSL